MKMRGGKKRKKALLDGFGLVRNNLVYVYNLWKSVSWFDCNWIDYELTLIDANKVLLGWYPKKKKGIVGMVRNASASLNEFIIQLGSRYRLYK